MNNSGALVFFVVVLMSVIVFGAPHPKTTNNKQTSLFGDDDFDSDFDLHYDQRQNGTHNYHISIDGVVIALPSSIGGSDSGIKDPISDEELATLLGLSLNKNRDQNSGSDESNNNNNGPVIKEKDGSTEKASIVDGAGVVGEAMQRNNYQEKQKGGSRRK